MRKLRSKPEDKLLSRKYRDRVARVADAYISREIGRIEQQRRMTVASAVMIGFLAGVFLTASIARTMM